MVASLKYHVQYLVGFKNVDNRTIQLDSESAMLL